MHPVEAGVICVVASDPCDRATVRDRLPFGEATLTPAIDRLLDRDLLTDEGRGVLTLAHDLQYDEESLSVVLPETYDVIVRDRVTSTNAMAWEALSATDPPLLVVADRQSAGRGRRDRPWASPPGGIWTTVAPEPPPAVEAAWLDQLAMADAAMAATRAVGVDTEVKWPNDVVTTDGAKLGGVLMESKRDANGRPTSIVGVGINANVDRAHLPVGATSLLDRRGPIDRVALIGYLVWTFEEVRSDPARVLGEWRSRSHTLERTVRIRTERGTHVGRATELCDDGSLRVGRTPIDLEVRPERCRRLRHLESGD